MIYRVLHKPSKIVYGKVRNSCIIVTCLTCIKVNYLKLDIQRIFSVYYKYSVFASSWYQTTVLKGKFMGFSLRVLNSNHCSMYIVIYLSHSLKNSLIDLFFFLLLSSSSVIKKFVYCFQYSCLQFLWKIFYQFCSKVYYIISFNFLSKMRRFMLKFIKFNRMISTVYIYVWYV